MTGKARPRTLFLISGVWFGIALLLVCLSRRWLMGLEHQAWGTVTVTVFLVYVVLVIGWFFVYAFAVEANGSLKMVAGARHSSLKMIL